MFTKSYLLSSVALHSPATEGAPVPIASMSAFQLVDDMVDKTDEVLEAVAEQYLTDKLWATIGPVPLAVQSMVTYGMERIAAFPPINSAPAGKDKHRGPVVGHNEPADWYKVEKKKKSKKDQYRSHSQDLAERTPIGKAILKQLSDIAAADVGQSKREATGPYSGLPANELAALSNYWKPRHTNYVKAVRQSINIVQQLGRLSGCKNVMVTINTTPTKQPGRSFPMPQIEGAPWAEGTVYLYPTAKPFYVSTIAMVNGKPLAIGNRGLTVLELLAWDVEKAGGVDATLDTLDATSSRGKPEEDDSDVIAAIESADDAEEYADELFAYLEKPGFRKDYIAFMKKDAGKDALTVTFRLYERLRNIFGDADLRDIAVRAIKAEEAAGDPGDKPVEQKVA